MGLGLAAAGLAISAATSAYSIYSQVNAKKQQSSGTTKDSTDEAVSNAKLMERRQDIGLMGRMSTYLGTGQSNAGSGGGGASTINPPTNVLGQ